MKRPLPSRCRMFLIVVQPLLGLPHYVGVLLVGFAYLWRFGYLDWVRSAATTSVKIDYKPGIDLRREARVDRPI